MTKSLEALIADESIVEFIKDKISKATNNGYEQLTVPITDLHKLIAALEQAQQKSAELLFAYREEHKAYKGMVAHYKQRITELESLCVNPGTAMRGVEPLCVKLQPELWEISVPGEVAHSHAYHGPEDGDYSREQVVERFYSESQLRAAGVQVEGGSAEK